MPARKRAWQARGPLHDLRLAALWDTLAEDFDSRVLNLGFGGSTLQACDYFFARLGAASESALADALCG